MIGHFPLRLRKHKGALFITPIQHYARSLAPNNSIKKEMKGTCIMIEELEFFFTGSDDCLGRKPQGNEKEKASWK